MVFHETFSEAVKPTEQALMHHLAQQATDKCHFKALKE
jgi:hypothetical protein